MKNGFPWFRVWDLGFRVYTDPIPKKRKTGHPWFRV